MTTFGKYRHLSQCSTDAGHFCILAIDHRGNLRDELQRTAAGTLTDGEFSDFKLAVIRALAPAASAVLTDPAYGIGPGVMSGTFGGRLALLAPLEITDYSQHPSRRPLRIIPNWSVEKIKRAGLSGVKLLVNYHPRAANAREMQDAIATIAAECARFDIPLFLEPIAYPLEEGRTLDNTELLAVVVESVRALSLLGVDVMKVQFPLDTTQEPDIAAWRAALLQIDAVSAVPWTLLSAGVGYDTFRQQAQMACEAGASGVIVGRAIWAEAASVPAAGRENFLRTTARQRIAELATICTTYAKDWRERTPAPQAGFDWYETY